MRAWIVSALLIAFVPCAALASWLVLPGPFAQQVVAAASTDIYGYDIIGSSQSTHNYNAIVLNKITLTATKTSGDYYVYCNADTGTALPVILDSSGNVLWNNGGISLTPTASTWVSTAFSGLSLAAGTFWVGFISSSSIATFYTKYEGSAWTTGDVKYGILSGTPSSQTLIDIDSLSNSGSPRSIYVEM